MKQITTSQIFEELRHLFTEIIGEERTVTRVSPVEDCSPGDLVFAGRASYIPLLEANRPSAAVVSPAMKEQLAHLDSITLLFAKNVSLAHALVRSRYDDRNFHDSGWAGVHPSAVIHPGVTLPSNCLIGPGVVIGPGVALGENCVIMANTVIEENVTLGKNAVIHPCVVVGYDSVIGDGVTIKSGSVIGSDGFGFAQDENRRSHRIPQRGKVVIENDVVIGANNCIDRATYAVTRIGRGTKLDNLCHIAHNVEIGEDCLLTAGCVVAGSTKIGNRVMASGQTGILDHLTIADDTVFVHRAGVTSDITKPGAYAGLPAQPLDQYKKNAAALRGLNELRKKVLTLEKQVADLAGAPRTISSLKNGYAVFRRFYTKGKYGAGLLAAGFRGRTSK